MALKNLEFNETGDKKFKVSFSTSGKINVFLDRVDNSDVMIYLYPKGFDPVLYKVIKPEKTDVLIDMEIPGDGEITVDIVSNSEVINACYVTSAETFVYSVPASSIIFDDGKSFQQKLESGELKGQKGDKGATGATGAKGADGKSVKAISLTPILPARSPVGNARCLITQRLPSPLPRLPFDDFSRLSRFFTYWSRGDTLTVSISSKVS